MILVAAIGWGLLLAGAAAHATHFARLVEMLGRHFRTPRPVAVVVLTIELALAMGVPVTVLARSGGRVAAGIVGIGVGVAFTGWILRLLTTDSDLPCACSFSDRPPSIWSLIRAGAVILVGAVAWAEIPADTGETVAALATGLAAGTALYLLPEALQWPDAMRAQMSRIDAAEPDTDSAGSGL